MHWRAVRSSRVTDRRGLGLGGLEVASISVSRKTLSPQCSCTSGAPRLARLQHVVNRRQLLEVDLDQRRDILGLGAGRRDAHRDRARRRGAPCRSRAPAASDGLKPGQRRCRRGSASRRRGRSAMKTRRADAPGVSRSRLMRRMRDRAAQERDLQHAGQPDVADKAAAAAHEAVVLLADQARAYSLPRHLRCPTTQRLVLSIGQADVGVTVLTMVSRSPRRHGRPRHGHRRLFHFRG